MIIRSNTPFLPKFNQNIKKLPKITNLVYILKVISMQNFEIKRDDYEKRFLQTFILIEKWKGQPDRWTWIYRTVPATLGGNNSVFIKRCNRSNTEKNL